MVTRNGQISPFGALMLESRVIRKPLTFLENVNIEKEIKKQSILTCSERASNN
jgi:hypothetical protein